MPSPEVLVFAPLIVFTAYVIFGISGFGSTLIAVPLLAHLMPLKFVIPVILLLDCVSAISMGLRLRVDVWKPEFLPLLPFLLIGMLAGAFALLNVPAPWLLLILGGFVLVFGTNYLIARKPIVHLPRWAAAPTGLFAGITSSALGIGGPIYVFYFAARGATPDQIRATVPAVFSFTTIARIAIFTSVGLFNTQILIAAAVLLPVMALGLWCGHRLHGWLTREHTIRIIGGLLLLSGASLIVRALQN
jgi:uncharacterized membrane protein YfcA